MLLTDGNPNTTEELRVYESAILSVANAEGIDLGVKLALATEEVTQDVMDFLLDRGGDTRRQAGVSDVVVTRQMKRWHALHTLEVMYRDAFHNQLNDRYKEKFAEYKRLAAGAKAQTFQFGVGLVYRPLPAAPAPEFGIEEGPLGATTYFVRVAWAAADGSEGAPSEVTSFDAPAGTVPVVAMGEAPENAVGFHVYMGLTPEDVAKQTEDAVPIGEAFTLGEGGVQAGAAPGFGQAPDLYLAGTRGLRRG